MKNLVTIFAGAAIMGCLGLALGVGGAYAFGEFSNPDTNVTTPLSILTGMCVIVGGCFGAMRNDLRPKP